MGEARYYTKGGKLSLGSKKGQFAFFQSIINVIFSKQTLPTLGFFFCEMMLKNKEIFEAITMQNECKNRWSNERGRKLPRFTESVIIIFFPWQSSLFIIANHMRTHYAQRTKTSVRLAEPRNWRSRNNHKRDIRGGPTSASGLCVCCVCVCLLRGHYITFEWCNALPERISGGWQKSTSDSPELRLPPHTPCSAAANHTHLGSELGDGWMSINGDFFFFTLIRWIIIFDPLYLLAKSAHVEWALFGFTLRSQSDCNALS